MHLSFGLLMGPFITNPSLSIQPNQIHPLYEFERLSLTLTGVEVAAHYIFLHIVSSIMHRSLDHKMNKKRKLFTCKYSLVTMQVVLMKN